MAKDYYELLGVSKNATQDEIKKAFRKLAHEHHPDKESGNESKFKEINEAYQTLSNEQKRKQYDTFGSTGPGAGGFNYQDFARSQGGPFGGFGGQQQGGASFDFGNMEDLGDIFGSFFDFGGSRGGRRQSRGEDLEIEIRIDFEEAVFGVEKIVELSKKKVCENCDGDGAEPGSKVSVCETCKGSGQVSKMQQTIFGSIQTRVVCATCGGSGKKIEKKCHVCYGSGIVSGTEKIKITVPPGIENGQSLRLSGKGEAVSGGPAGDLYIKIHVLPSKKFKREGNIIRTEEHITISQAILGDKIQVETVDGLVNLKIPEGTQSHTEFRLRDKGVPNLNSRGRGDHLVNVIVDVPTRLSRQQKKLIEQAGI